MWGPLVIWCLNNPTHCRVCLFVHFVVLRPIRLMFGFSPAVIYFPRISRGIAAVWRWSLSYDAAIERDSRSSGGTQMPNLVGWRTLLWNVGVVGGTAAVTYMAGVDWTQYVDPTIAMFITAGVNTVLRVLTKTPVGVK